MKWAHWMLAVIAFGGGFPALFVSAQGQAKEQLPKTLPKNLMDTKCDEKSSIKISKGRVERRGKELVIWLPGYFPKESGMVFWNASPLTE
jgi:hypothetical protein